VDAPWCGQCYEPFPEAAQPGSEPEPAAAVIDEDMTWACRVCEERNPLPTDHCQACGASIFGVLAESRVMPEPDAALRASIVPGLGMGRVGMPGEGLIAAVLVGFAVLGGGVIVAAGEPLAVLLIGAGVAVWVVAARDAFVVAGSSRDAAWLQPRTLTVVAVMILLLTAAALLRAIPTRGTP
jgi:hypothetical protein